MAGPLRGGWGGEGPAIQEKITFFCWFSLVDLVTKDILLKITNRNIHIQVKFCCRSAKSSSFNWFVEILSNKYGFFSPKSGGKKKNCQNPFLTKYIKKKKSSRGGKVLMARPLKKGLVYCDFVYVIKCEKNTIFCRFFNKINDNDLVHVI